MKLYEVVLYFFSDSAQRTALHVTAITGNVEIVSQLLLHNAECDVTDEHNWTPLMNACVMGHAQVCQLLLLRANPEVDHADDEGVTALYLAAQEGHADICTLLLSRSANSDHPNEDGWRPLHIAAQNGHYDVVKLLTDATKRRDVIDAQTNLGVTPLYLAVQDGRAEVARLLIERGANVDAQTKDGVTALHVAIQNGHEEIVKMLLKSTKAVLREVTLAINHGCRFVSIRLLLMSVSSSRLKTERRQCTSPLNSVSTKF